MALSIVSRNEGEIALLRVSGSLTLGPGLRTFQSRVERVLKGKECTGMVLDFSGVTILDSAGIGALLAIHSSATGVGVRLMLAGVDKRVFEILAITRVDALFAFAEDEKSGIATLRG